MAFLRSSVGASRCIASEFDSRCAWFLLVALASGCSPSKHTSAQQASASAQSAEQAPPTPDALLQARLDEAMSSSAQTRASRRNAWATLSTVTTARNEPTQVRGRLAPAAIQKVVRENFGRFRQCYENGLRKNANLSGRVSVRLVIDTEGKVSNAGDGGSDLPDEATTSCVVKAFSQLSFPKPDGGMVAVVYPIVFSPGETSSSASATAPPAPSTATAAPPPNPPPVPIAQPNEVNRMGGVTPIVIIDGASIRVDGAVVGNAKAIEELGRMQKIDELFEALKSQYEQWKAKHPDETFAGVAGLRAGPNTSPLVFKSVFQTMAFAAFPNIYVQNASDPAHIVEFGAQVPIAPDPSLKPEPAPQLHIHISGAELALIWVLETKVISEVRGPIDSPNESLEAKICGSWKTNGRQRGPTDDQQDPLVVHIDQAVPLHEFMRVTQASDKCTREVHSADGQVRQKQVFWNVMSMR